MFTKNQTFTLTTDDSQELTYTIKDIGDTGKLLVHSSLLEVAYFVSPEAFEDFLKMIGYEEGPAKYRVYYINHQYYSEVDFDFINRAIEAGKQAGFEFRVELGSMICCAWDAITGLRFYAEYQLWKRNQEIMLGKVEGSYE